MNSNIAKNLVFRNVFVCAVAIAITSCGTATFSTTAFDAKVNEGNARFQQAIANDKFTARRPVLVDLKGQFDADAAHLRSKASRGKVTPALASEMKKDVNKIYDHALGR